MATYVYAPFGGGLSSRWDDTCTYGSRYCGDDGVCHGTGMGTRPVDIGAGSGGQWIDFWCDPGVLSLRTIAYAGTGCSGTYDAPWDNGTVVEMWSGTVSGGSPTGSLLGSVFFAHLDSPYIGSLNTGWDANQVLRGWTQWAKVAVQGACSGSCYNNCYQGPHVHMAAISPSCFNSGLGCGSTVTKGASWIYCFGA